MKKRFLPLLLFAAMYAHGVHAQRTMDLLDRGLVAVQTSNGVFCSWRILGEEYYDVKYNIYRNGTKLNAEPLSVSNFTDASGTASSQYTVEAVVNGKAQEKSKAVTPWNQNYLEVKMDHGSLTSTYIPNDACCADVDGDGEVEILLKFDNSSDAAAGYKPAGYNGEYAIIEVYKLNGKKLWWIDLGPNMGDFQNNENNIVAYDWDEDGKAEALMRAADGTTIHTADGQTIVIGDKTKNYRPSGGQSGQWFIHEGAEYLLYLNGETGEIYDQQDYPLKRLEDGETDLNKAWGDGYGHRSTKHFFGAPYLDGRHPSVFLARGIYTRHKMIAMDVNPATHKLSERWRWDCNTPGSAWYGQGYHNFGIADVDMDGRDEIVYGSMVIDDNGNGLSTTGLGHGDSQHCGDFDPYSHGLEIFACNEDRPNNNFRDATTSKIYYRTTGGNDDGRANAGNFSDAFPGAQMVSSRDGNLIGGASHKALSKGSKNNITQNFRIYWDGDLCDETFDYANGKNTAGTIYKYGVGRIETLEGSLTNNDTKGTPCYQGDVLGDWREEVIMRTADNNIRIYTTTDETPWRNYTLWHDMQYRNAMVWQMCGYNQTPHVSYFLGEMEGITQAPPALTMNGRTEVADGGTISGTSDETLISCETNDMTIRVADGASPRTYIDNAPTWVQGHDDNDNITTETYTHTLTGGAFGGDMRLVKQGDGILRLPNVTETYTGNTDVWAGTLSFDGTLQNSPLWLNRHTTLTTDGGRFMKGIKADYNATLNIGADDQPGTLETTDLSLGFGSRLMIDVFSEGTKADLVKANTLSVETKDWEDGPTYLAPVIQFVAHTAQGESTLAAGKYLIGEVARIEGNLSDIIVEGLGNGLKAQLSHEDGKLYLNVSAFEAGSVTWKGSTNGTWDVDATQNFTNDETGEASGFVQGDVVTFDDTAANTNVTVSGKVSPKKVTFSNDTKTYTLSGDSIVGGAQLVKNGSGTLVINNENRFGGASILGGRVNVTSLANIIGQECGALGTASQKIAVDNGAILGVLNNTTTSQTIQVGKGGATLDVASGATVTMSTGIKAVDRGNAVLTKSGAGTLTLGSGNDLSQLIINGGYVNSTESGGYCQLPATVRFMKGQLTDPNNEGSYTTNSANFVVGEGHSGTLLSKPRCNYTGSLTGSGTFTVIAGGVRNYYNGDWSQFEGELIVSGQKRGSYDASFDWNNSYGLPYAILNVPTGQEFKNNGKPVAVKALKPGATGTLSGTGVITLGAGYDADITLSNVIKSPLAYKGEEGRRLIVQNANAGNITSALTVKSGALYLQGTSRSDKQVLFNPGNTTTVEADGKMYGPYMYFYAANITNGGTISITGLNDAVTKAKITGALNVRSGAAIEFKIGSASSSSQLTGSGMLNLWSGSKVVVKMDPSVSLAKGTSFTLWNITGNFTGSADKVTVELPELPEGLKWDTSKLFAKTGVLSIEEDATGISGVAAGEALVADVYSLDGKRLGRVNTTKATLQADVKRLGGHGIYVLRFVSGAAGSMTITVK